MVCYLLASVFLSAPLPSPAMPNNSRPTADPQPEIRNPQSDGRLDWWREARFGMFIHWGLYSTLEGEWNGSKGHAEWIRTTAQIPVAEYEKLLAGFNPVKFDADAWARMAKDAGMKYLVITSKHHDGFCLFDSAHTEWDVMSTPFKRDILKELSDACKRHGVRFATYHSIMDWHHPDYLPKRGWEGETWRQARVGVPNLDKHVPNFDRFNEYLRKQVVEIIQKYDPGVMWFDGEWEATWTHAYGKPLYELCLKTNPRIIVNNRVDKGRGGMAGMTTGDHLGDFGTPEQEIPATGFPGVDWESCMTMNRNWGWNREDKEFKSTKEMIRMLVDIASKGGNFLMNIGPKPDGTFPEESVQRLKEIGEWMRVYGSSIYGTEAGPFKKLDWGRCTMRRSEGRTKLYLHVFDWPADGKLVVPGLGNEVVGASSIRSSSNAELPGARVRVPFARIDSDVVLELPRTAPDANCSVVELDVQGEPVVYEAPVIRADSDIFVQTLPVDIESSSKELAIRYTIDGSIPDADSPRYTGRLVLDETTALKARAFHGTKAVSAVTEATFTKVKPMPAVNLADYRPGLRLEVFKGDWNRMPDFDKLTPASKESASVISLGLRSKEEFVGLRFSGYLNVPEDQAYVFELTSDDGSRLLIDGKLVVDNDGLHSTETKRGVAPLARGWHAITVEWFNKTGGADLALTLAPVGARQAAPPADRLAHRP